MEQPQVNAENTGATDKNGKSSHNNNSNNNKNMMLIMFIIFTMLATCGMIIIICTYETSWWQLKVIGSIKSINMDKLISTQRWQQDKGGGAEKEEEEYTENTRIFCLVITSALQHNYRAVHIHRTWARHCNRTLFMSNAEHEELEAVRMLNVPSHLGERTWRQVKESFSYAYTYHRNEADWFLKVNDETFVVVENLRHLLKSYSPDTPIHFGCKLKDEQNQTYMYGNAGYVLSKEALRRFVIEALPNKTLCSQEDNDREDIAMGNCLRNVGVAAGDSRAPDGSSTFLPFTPEVHLKGINEEQHLWYLQQSYYNITNHTERMSHHAISFHVYQMPTMYTLYYFIYKLRLFGMEGLQPTVAPSLGLSSVSNDISIKL